MKSFLKIVTCIFLFCCASALGKVCAVSNDNHACAVSFEPGIGEYSVNIRFYHFPVGANSKSIFCLYQSDGGLRAVDIDSFGGGFNAALLLKQNHEIILGIPGNASGIVSGYADIGLSNTSAYFKNRLSLVCRIGKNID